MVGDLADRWSQETGIEVDPVQDGRSAITQMLAGRMPGGDEVPLSEIDRRLRRWIVDRYNAIPIPGIKRSPLDLWREAAVGFVPRFVPADAPRGLFRPARFSAIGPRGVTWDGARWSLTFCRVGAMRGPTKSAATRRTSRASRSVRRSVSGFA